MNLKKRIKHLAELNTRDRMNQVDDTKLVSLINTAKENGGLFITTSLGEAKRMERKFGFPVRSYDVNFEGYAGPFFFDPQAIEEILMKAYNKIEELETERDELEEKLKELTPASDDRDLRRPSDPETLALETYENIGGRK